MTTLVAVKKGGRVYLAADKRVTMDNWIRHFQVNKIHKFGKAYIGCTGMAVSDNELSFFIADPENAKSFNLESHEGIYKFFTGFKQWVSSRCLEEGRDVGLLIITSHGIFSATSWNGPEMIPRDYHTLGSSELVLCYLGEYIMKGRKSGPQIIKEFMQKAADIDFHTSREYDVVSIKLSNDISKSNHNKPTEKKI